MTEHDGPPYGIESFLARADGVAAEDLPDETRGRLDGALRGLNPGLYGNDGGSDPPDDEPIELRFPRHLDSLADPDNDQFPLDGTYELVSTVELSPSAAPDKWNDIVIGSVAEPFTGTFDGGNNEIRDHTIDIDGGRNVGLFGVVGEDARIENLGVSGADVTGESGVGLLAGRNRGTITGSYATGTVRGPNDMGAIAGLNEGSISNCAVNGQIFPADGQSSSSDRRNVGGIAGRNTDSIALTYTRFNAAGGRNVGGIAGKNEGSVTASYALDRVSGDTNLGGLVGYNAASGRVETAYWDEGYIGTRLSVGIGKNDGVKSDIDGLSREQMRGDSARSTMSGLDFDEDWVIGGPDFGNRPPLLAAIPTQTQIEL
ncbi:GLUG motif-containing protein [Haloplanus salilacus]|uniref:GLUG motif-containing protein n=1 Tax=Haloplanus salilacus TaxID=2949994 RepID=UPI0030D3FDE8